MSFGFGLRAFKKFPELIPLASIIGTAVVGAVVFTGYAFFTKPDVSLNKKDPIPPFERVKPDETRKLHIVSEHHYVPIPELEALRKEIGPYRAR